MHSRARTVDGLPRLIGVDLKEAKLGPVIAMRISGRQIRSRLSQTLTMMSSMSLKRFQVVLKPLLDWQRMDPHAPLCTRSPANTLTPQQGDGDEGRVRGSHNQADVTLQPSKRKRDPEDSGTPDCLTSKVSVSIISINPWMCARPPRVLTCNVTTSV